MGYIHLPNLYKDTAILLFRECFALEKVHGTSAHIIWHPRNGLHLSPGGGNIEDFRALFDLDDLKQRFTRIGKNMTVYGEFYGGYRDTGQGMVATYGEKQRFIVFDIKVAGQGTDGSPRDCWLNVPAMTDVATKLGLDVVPWEKIPTTMEAIDAARDADSLVAIRCGTGAGHRREGVVLRPLIELTKNNGERLIAKHKREEFVERQNQPEPTVDPGRLQVLEGAEAIADEWVVPMRLEHVLQKLDPPATTIRDTGRVVAAMVEDVLREAEGEIVVTKDAKTAIGRKAAELFKLSLKESDR